MTNTEWKNNTSETANDNPFAPEPPDENEELDGLTRALRLIDGFALFIVSCNQAPQRDRLMNEVESRLPDAHIQRVPVQQEERNLIYLLREILESPVPDAVFVYGMEAWLPAGEVAENSPFVRNLNAARNHYPKDVPCPMVLWLPQHLVVAVAHGAPDFFSVRSGLYAFAPTPQYRDYASRVLTSVKVAAIVGTSPEEREKQIMWLNALLSEYQALPTDMRDLVAELHLSNSLGICHHAEGDFANAEQYYKQALNLAEQLPRQPNDDLSSCLQNIASLYQSQGKYDEAEHLYEQALQITEEIFGVDAPQVASDLNNVASLYRKQGRYTEAKALFERALAIEDRSAGQHRPLTAIIMNNIAALHLYEKRYAEAESLLIRALSLDEALLGPNHPYVATDLNNLSSSYFLQGRYSEAEPLLQRTLAIREATLGPTHPELSNAYENYSVLLQLMGRNQESADMLQRAEAIQKAHEQKNAAS